MQLPGNSSGRCRARSVLPSPRHFWPPCSAATVQHGRQSQPSQRIPRSCVGCTTTGCVASHVTRVTAHPRHLSELGPSALRRPMASKTGRPGSRKSALGPGFHGGPQASATDKVGEAALASQLFQMNGLRYWSAWCYGACRSSEGDVVCAMSAGMHSARMEGARKTERVTCTEFIGCQCIFLLDTLRNRTRIVRAPI